MSSPAQPALPQYPPFGAVQELEAYLGDPHDTTVTFSYARCTESDIREEFPREICARLEAWGMHNFYVPVQFGGRLDSYEHALHLLRVIARRDLTVAIGHGSTFLGAVSAWVGAGEELAGEIAREVLAGTPISWGLTEREHGSDLLAGEVVAVAAGDGYRISGEKWLINNATRSRIMALLARTVPEGGPRGFDVIFVDKARVEPDSYTCLPKVPTHGIRGADISGISYDDAVAPGAARVGAAGAGLEVVLKGLQLTRTMCAGLALGGSEHAIRIACSRLADVVQPEATSDAPSAESRWARRCLLDAYTDHVCNEVVSTIAVRCIHHLPAEMSLVSAVVKYLVPLRTDALVASLREAVGFGSVGDDEDCDSMLDKVARDTRIIDLFDGNRVINLHAIVNQFPLLSAAWARPVDWRDVQPLFDLSTASPPVEHRRLRLASSKGLSLLRVLPSAVAELERIAAVEPRLGQLAAAARSLAEETARLHEQLTALPPAGVQVPVQHFRCAERLALCVAGAAAIGTWVGATLSGAAAHAEPLWADGAWLSMVLGRLLTALGVPVQTERQAADLFLAEVFRQVREGLLLSLWPCRLAESGLP